MSGSWNSIDREQILRWSAESPEAESTLPELIERLIIETCPTVTFVDAPARTGISTAGFDLIAECTDGSLYVPSGTSVWELSVRKDAHVKAEEDYAKRTAGPAGKTTRETHYRSVSSRAWTKRKTFDGHERDGNWKSVRGLNVDSLVAWLSIAPATTAWMRTVLGSPIDGEIYWQTWWSSWTQSTKVELGLRLVLGGRAAAEAAISTISQEPGIYSVGGQSLQWPGFVAFVCAAAQRSIEADPLSQLASRLVIFDKREAFLMAVSTGRRLVALIPEPDWTSSIPTHSQASVLVLTTPASRTALEIPPVDSETASDELRLQEVPFGEAWDLGTLARRDLITLRRVLAKQPALYTPRWAKSPLSRRECRGSLIPVWNRQFQGDLELVAGLVDASPTTAQESWLDLFGQEERPTAAFGDLFFLVSPTDTFELVRESLRDEDLERFAGLALEALRDEDRLLAMEVADRLREQAGGGKPRFSKDLIHAICTSLAILGSSPRSGQFGASTAAYANRIVRSCLWSDGDALPLELLYVRRIQLDLLAEAAPEAVLDYLAEAIRDNPTQTIFTDKARESVVSFGIPSPHLAMLRALEILGWSDSYAEAAVDLLLEMNRVDPGGRWSNRPLATLGDILGPSSPSSAIPWDRRIEIIESQLRKDPSRSWSAFASLVTSDPAGIVSSGPRYRPWGPRDTAGSTEEVEARCGGMVDLLLPILSDVEQGIMALEWLTEVDQSTRIKITDRLAAVAEEWQEGQKVKLYTTLRAVVARHQDYSEAPWALSDTQLAELRALRDLLEPSDPRLLHEWLFVEPLPASGSGDHTLDWATRSSTIARLRSDALLAVENSLGFDAMIEYGVSHPDVSYAASALADGPRKLSEAELLDLLNREEARHSQLAISYLGRAQTSEPQLISTLLASAQLTSSHIRARILSTLTKGNEALDALETEEPTVVDAYWELFDPYRQTFDRDGIDLAFRALVDRHLTGTALTLLEADNSIPEPEKVADALVTMARHGSGGTMPSAYSLDRFTTIISLDETLSEEAEEAEWAFLPALPSGRQLALHRRIAADPEAFLEVVRLSGSDIDAQSSRALKLLNSWATLPGADPDGITDSDNLNAWITSVETLAADMDEREQHRISELIGGLFSTSVADPADTFWPQAAIREVVNNRADEALEVGIARGLFNGRGVVSRNIRTGGDAERALAEHYRSQAAALPRGDRVGGVLRRLADGYDADSTFEDYRSEAMRLGLGR